MGRNEVKTDERTLVVDTGPPQRWWHWSERKLLPAALCGWVSSTPETFGMAPPSGYRECPDCARRRRGGR